MTIPLNWFIIDDTSKVKNDNQRFRSADFWKQIKLPPKSTIKNEVLKNPILIFIFWTWGFGSITWEVKVLYSVCRRVSQKNMYKCYIINVRPYLTSFLCSGKNHIRQRYCLKSIWFENIFQIVVFVNKDSTWFANHKWCSSDLQF